MTAVGVLKTRLGQLHRTDLLATVQLLQGDALLKHIEADSTWLPWRRLKLRREAKRLHQKAQVMLDDYNTVYRSNT